MPSRRRKVDPLGTIEMDIEIPEQPARSQNEERRRPRYQKPSGYAKCPVCGNANLRSIGYVRVGNHYQWKVHDRVMMNHSRVICQASGMTLCQVPPSEAFDTAGHPIECACGPATRLERVEL